MFCKYFALKFKVLTPKLHNHNTQRYISKTLFCMNSVTMPVSRRRGAFIVFEGCDRSGKTTQCKKLVEVLTSEGKNVKFLRFPERDTAIGKVISNYLEKKCELEDHAVHLLFAANRWEAVPKIKDLLSQGTTLIVDRYSFSGVAFTAAKQGLDFNWCKQPEIGLPKPDAVLYLTLTSEEASKRGAFGQERYEETEFQKTVAKNYTLLKEDSWKEIDASKSIDELHEEIKKVVLDIMTDAEQKELGYLWTDNEKQLKRRTGTGDNNESEETDFAVKKLKQKTADESDMKV